LSQDSEHVQHEDVAGAPYWSIRVPGLPKATAGMLLAVLLGFLLTEHFNPTLFAMKTGARAIFQPWRVFTQAFVTSTPLGALAALVATWWSVGILEEDRGPRQALYFTLAGAVAAGLVGLALPGVRGPGSLVFAALGALAWTRLEVGVKLSSTRQLDGRTLAALVFGASVAIYALQGLGPLFSTWVAIVAGAWCARQAGDQVCVLSRTYQQAVPRWLDSRLADLDVAIDDNDIGGVAKKLKTQLAKEVEEIKRPPAVVSERDRLSCASCGAPTAPTDRFCMGCGQAQALGTQQSTFRGGGTRFAFGVLIGLAIYTAVVGTIAFAVIHQQQQPIIEAARSQERLDGLTSAERHRIAEENDRRNWPLRKRALLVLGVNLMIATLFLGLAFWSKRAPLPALLVASAIYLVITVLTILQSAGGSPISWVGRVVVIYLLVTAIRRAYVTSPRAIP